MRNEARLVVISENPEIRRAVSETFADGRFHVHLIGYTDDVQDYLHEHPADLVLFDLGRDLGRNLTLLAQLREEWARDMLAILVLSDSADSSLLKQYLEAGAGDVVMKPLDLNLLTVCIHAALARKDRLTLLLENERQRVLTEALARASASTAIAVESMIDELEGAMSEPNLPALKMQAYLNDMLARTEETVAVIDSIRRIATLKEVPYATRTHLLEKLTETV